MSGRYVRWLAVEGASGSGKSSFVRAGVVPALRRGWVDGGPARWRVAVLRPDRNPVHRLAGALVEAFGWKHEAGKLTQVEEALRPCAGLRDLLSQWSGDGVGFLLVVDQLEETFTLSGGNSGAARQLDALLAEALADDGPLHLITTLRSDFLGRMAELPRLADALNGQASRYLLNPLSPTGLLQASVARPRWQTSSGRRGCRTASPATPMWPVAGCPWWGTCCASSGSAGRGTC